MFTTTLLAPLMTMSLCVLLTKTQRLQIHEDVRHDSWEEEPNLFVPVTPIGGRVGEPHGHGHEVHDVPTTTRRPGESADPEDEDPELAKLSFPKPVPRYVEYFPENFNCTYTPMLYWQDDCTVKYIEPFTDKEKSNCEKICRSTRFERSGPWHGHYPTPKILDLFLFNYPFYGHEYISGFSFKECSFMRRSPVPRRNMTRTEKHATIEDHYIKLKLNSLLMANYLSNVFTNTHGQNLCPFVRKAPVAEFPTAKLAQNVYPLTVLLDYYRSLLYHTGHMFFVANQHEFGNLTRSCLNLKESAFILKFTAQRMVQISCELRLVLLQKYEEDSVYLDKFFKDLEKELYDEELNDLRRYCPASKIRDCSVIYSSLKMLSEMSRYLYGLDIFKPYFCFYELS